MIGHLVLDKAKSIDGWMSDRELEWLAENASGKKRILEVGSYKGRSARAIADNFDGILYCVDPWNGDYYNQHGDKLDNINTNCYSEFTNNLSGTKAIICPIRGYFSDVQLELEFDMIFIDGDHRYTNVAEDIRKAMVLISPNGIICGHDYGREDWQGVKKAVDDVFRNIQLVDTIWIKKF